MHTTFRPAWWLRHPHLQTVWPTLTRKRPSHPYRHQRLQLPDSDFVDLAWTASDSGPIVIVLHGLEGSLHSPYAGGILQAIHQQGWRGVLMHFRGCSGVPNRLPRRYHSGDTGDLAFLVQTLRNSEPHTPLLAVGYSIGGNVLLKWLGEQGTSAPLTAAVAVSVPFELDKTERHIEKSLGGFYQRRLLRRMKRAYRRKFTNMNGPVPLTELAKLKTFRSFDDKVTAPLHGFAGVDDYYQRASSRQYLRHIRTPTLIIHALDDPFMTPAVVPSPEELSDTIDFELTKKGGHVGFISGRWPWRAEYWLEKRIVEYLRTCFL